MKAFVWTMLVAMTICFAVALGVVYRYHHPIPQAAIPTNTFDQALFDRGAVLGAQAILELAKRRGGNVDGLSGEQVTAVANEIRKQQETTP